MKDSGLFKVSQSKVNTYRLCVQKYSYRYVELLEKRTKSRPLKFGTIVHKMAEAHAAKKDPIKVLKQIEIKDRKLFRAEREAYGDIVADSTYIMKAYIDFWKKEPLEYIKVEGRLAEHPLEMKIDDGILFKGKVDGFAKNKGMRWLVEHKTHKSIPNDDHRWRNLQTCVYIPVSEMHGWGKLDGVVWDYVRSKPPTRPQVLKSGELSTRQLDSLPQVVIDILRENNLNLSDYSELIASQELNMTTYFQRTYTPTKPKVIKAIFSDFLTTAREMADKKRKPVKNIGIHCSWCAYESLCRAQLQGNDVEFIKEREYVHEEEFAHYEEDDE